MMIEKLNRFLLAQDRAYEQALKEIKSGQKTGHWMWFVFPQIGGLGSSETSEYYAIENLFEANAFLRHPILGLRLVECTRSLLNLKGVSAAQIFGYPDELKLCSSMTLFELVSDPSSIFAAVLEAYFGGKRDIITQRLAKDSKE
jgi:uncharacterized protein (DUF1810 family)